MKVINAYCPLERPFDVSSVPVVHDDAVKILWVNGFWDTPRSGICEFERSRRWFQHYYDPWYYLDEEKERDALDQALLRLVDGNPPALAMLIHELTVAELAEEENWHRLFVEHVGGHFDYTGEHDSKVKPSSEHAKFYAPYNTQAPTLDLAKAPVVAVWVRRFETH